MPRCRCLPILGASQTAVSATATVTAIHCMLRQLRKLASAFHPLWRLAVSCSGPASCDAGGGKSRLNKAEHLSGSEIDAACPSGRANEAKPLACPTEGPIIVVITRLQDRPSAPLRTRSSVESDRRLPARRDPARHSRPAGRRWRHRQSVLRRVPVRQRASERRLAAARKLLFMKPSCNSPETEPQRRFLWKRLSRTPRKISMPGRMIS